MSDKKVIVSIFVILVVLAAAALPALGQSCLSDRGEAIKSKLNRQDAKNAKEKRGERQNTEEALP